MDFMLSVLKPRLSLRNNFLIYAYCFVTYFSRTTRVGDSANVLFGEPLNVNWYFTITHILFYHVTRCGTIACTNIQGVQFVWRKRPSQNVQFCLRDYAKSGSVYVYSINN